MCNKCLLSYNPSSDLCGRLQLYLKIAVHISCAGSLFQYGPVEQSIYNAINVFNQSITQSTSQTESVSQSINFIVALVAAATALHTPLSVTCHLIRPLELSDIGRSVFSFSTHLPSTNQVIPLHVSFPDILLWQFSFPTVLRRRGLRIVIAIVSHVIKFWLTLTSLTLTWILHDRRRALSPRQLGFVFNLSLLCYATLLLRRTLLLLATESILLCGLWKW